MYINIFRNMNILRVEFLDGSRDDQFLTTDMKNVIVCIIIYANNLALIVTECNIILDGFTSLQVWSLWQIV